MFFDFQNLQIQHTPNPEAQLPSVVPPFDPHSDDVKQVPYVVVSDLAVHWLNGYKII